MGTGPVSLLWERERPGPPSTEIPPARRPFFCSHKRFDASPYGSHRAARLPASSYRIAVNPGLPARIVSKEDESETHSIDVHRDVGVLRSDDGAELRRFW